MSPAPSRTATWFGVLAASRPAVRHERLVVRLGALAVAVVLGLGRQRPTRWLATLGVAARDGTAWHRLFDRDRLPLATLHGTRVGQVLEAIPATEPVVAVAVDATPLPRTRGTLPGRGVTRALRGLRWPRGAPFAQCSVGLSARLPRSVDGDRRAVPLKWRRPRSAKTRPLGEEPDRTEAGGAREVVGWLRGQLAACRRATQRLLVPGDGRDRPAPFLAALPHHVTVLARCARNRALFAWPTDRATGRGRQPRSGQRGPTPEATLHAAAAGRPTVVVRVRVRGRTIPLTVAVTGPWLIQGAPFPPLAVIVVRGIDRGKGTPRRQRAPQCFLVTLAVTPEDEWDLPLPLEEVLAWAWQRWDVEVLPRELPSGFGLGQHQAFSTHGVATIVPWLVWRSARLILTG